MSQRKIAKPWIVPLRQFSISRHFILWEIYTTVILAVTPTPVSHIGKRGSYENSKQGLPEYYSLFYFGFLNVHIHLNIFYFPIVDWEEYRCQGALLILLKYIFILDVQSSSEVAPNGINAMLGNRGFF